MSVEEDGGVSRMGHDILASRNGPWSSIIGVPLASIVIAHQARASAGPLTSILAVTALCLGGVAGRIAVRLQNTA